MVMFILYYLYSNINLDTIIKRLAGLYTDREDIVNRFALLSGIVGDSEELLFR